MSQGAMERHVPGCREDMNGDDPGVLRVMSYNVYGCVDAHRRINLPRIVQIIDDISPGIVALQEVDFEKPLSANRNQARSISERLGLDFCYEPLEKMGRHAFGLAILSRHPLEKPAFTLLPNLHASLNMRKRGALRALIRTPIGEIDFINTHLSVFRIERYLQLRAVLQWSDLARRSRERPVIFCGDLNAKPGSLSYRSVTRYLTDVQKAPNLSSRPEPTFPAKVPTFRIDHIFISHHYRIDHCKVVRNALTIEASDHLPLMAELKRHSADKSLQ